MAANALTALHRFVAQHGSQRKAATALGVSNTFISLVLSGRRAVSPRILKALGLERGIVRSKAS